jgi:putative tryptophan/tyrosine transport system substrate-binding protein
MRRREFLGVLTGGAAAWPFAARAQQAMREVGFLSGGSPGDLTLVADAFRQGLDEAGYVEGQSVAFQYRWVEDQFNRLPSLATDLARRRVAVIVASFYREAHAARAATTTIPIVFISASNPVNLVANLDRPGGNITGVSQFNPTLELNRFELLRELMPKAKLVGVFIASDRGIPALEVEVMRATARTVKQPIQVISVASEKEIEPAFARLYRRRATALLVNAGPLFVRRRDQIVALAARYSIPAIYDFSDFPAAGGLMSYGPSMTDTYRQAGIYVGKILNGTKLSELPVVKQTKLRLVINLKTAKALGITVPPTLIARADEVIE